MELPFVFHALCQKSRMLEIVVLAFTESMLCIVQYVDERKAIALSTLLRVRDNCC